MTIYVLYVIKNSLVYFYRYERDHVMIETLRAITLFLDD
ncbi:hypothetical protein VDIAB_250352 [Vibrio diabolicus]|nr:hypothetical protein VDIAB_250352 [Vibrio diabolicus]